MIAVVDYRAGNLTSVMKALNHLGANAVISNDPDLISKADKIILPGVGHFSATAALESGGLRAAIQHGLERGAAFLGICLGMQWMFESSEEAPAVPGLGWFPGGCTRFPREFKSPHVGWNSLVCDNRSRLFRRIPSGCFVYFTHSYRAPVVRATVACCEYGGAFSAAVEQGQLFGVQFHPEKSGAAGMKILESFCSL
jgi:imidazole glycerol-phosphate synthase subunit HisH